MEQIEIMNDLLTINSTIKRLIKKMKEEQERPTLKKMTAIGGNNSQATRDVVNSKKGFLEQTRVERNQEEQKREAEDTKRPKNLS